MFKLTIQGDGLNFDTEIGEKLTKMVIMTVIDKKFTPTIRPTVVQAAPAAEPIQMAEPESEPETEDGDPP